MARSRSASVGGRLSLRYGDLNEVAAACAEIMEGGEAEWRRENVPLFVELRTWIVRSKGDPEILDAVHQREGCLKFLMRYLRGCRPISLERLAELFRIILLSEKWWDELSRLSGGVEENFQLLPESVQQQFAAKAAEVSQRAAGGSSSRRRGRSKSICSISSVSSGMGQGSKALQLGPNETGPCRGALVVLRRVRSAKLLLRAADPEKWTAISEGLLVLISFGPATTSQHLLDAATFALTSTLAPEEAGVTDICGRFGRNQGLLVMPALHPNADGSKTANYEEVAFSHYKGFVENIINLSSQFTGVAPGTPRPKGLGTPRLPKLVYAPWRGPYVLESVACDGGLGTQCSWFDKVSALGRRLRSASTSR